MKKRYLIIIILVLLILGFITSYLDSARVRNSIEPKFTIKVVSKDGSRVTYWGLGYKVVRYVSVSPKEPYKNNRGVKYGSWFMKYNLEEQNDKNFIPTKIKNISVQISDISLTGATITIKDTNIVPSSYGEWYKIEKNINGKWQELKPIVDNYGFNEIAYFPNENKEVEFNIDWELLYGKLDNGSYRIVKRVNNKYISIEFNISTTSVPKLEVVKSQISDTNKFNKYLQRDNRTIYLSSEIEEIYYYKNSNNKISLKDHINNSYQTLNDSLQEITNLLTHIDTYKDGGTTIYKSENYDITLIKCENLSGNNNIYIGDYSLKFDYDEMCN